MCFRPATTIESKCPECGAPLAFGIDECKMCGAKIEKDAPSDTTPTAPTAPDAPKAPGAPTPPKAPGTPNL